MKLQERSGVIEHTEHEWQAAPTTPLSYAQQLPIERRNTLLAYALLAGGLLLLGGRFGLFGATGIAIIPGLILGTIATCFLYFAYWQRWYPLLIPGCILAGLALGVPLAPVFGGTPVLWGLALGFLAIGKLGRDNFGEAHPWPMVPAVILFAVGAIVGVAQLGSTLAAVASLWLPLLLIGAGLAYVYRQRSAVE